MTARTVLALAGGLALGLAAAKPADAALMTVNTSRSLSSTPFTITVGTGVFRFTSASTGVLPGADGAAVETGSTGRVTTFFGSVADFGAGAEIGGSTGYNTFSAISPAQTIPNSAAVDYVGFSYADALGATHYGFAEVFGPSLVGYAYETTAGASVTTFDVPEPASAALLLAGVAGAATIRRRRSGAAVAA